MNLIRSRVTSQVDKSVGVIKRELTPTSFTFEGYDRFKGLLPIGNSKITKAKLLEHQFSLSDSSAVGVTEYAVRPHILEKCSLALMLRRV